MVDESTGPMVARWLNAQGHVDVKIATLRSLLRDFAERLSDQFVVVTEQRVRFGQRAP